MLSIAIYDYQKIIWVDSFELCTTGEEGISW